MTDQAHARIIGHLTQEGERHTEAVVVGELDMNGAPPVRDGYLSHRRWPHEARCSSGSAESGPHEVLNCLWHAGLEIVDLRPRGGHVDPRHSVVQSVHSFLPLRELLGGRDLPG